MIRRSHYLALLVLLCLVGLMVAVLVLRSPENTKRYEISAPKDYSGVPIGFLPEQMIWAKPLIKMLGCMVAQNAVRHRLRPASVGFEPCSGNGAIQATLNDNLIDMTVSGIAKVNGTDMLFSVVLQHYPPSTNTDDFFVMSIEIK
jgi:hypothetical protein